MGKTVLVAGEPRPTGQTLSFLLSNRGYNVVEASDGQEALEQARTLLPDLVVLEAELPEPSGYQVFRLMKEDPATRHIPVLLLIATTEEFSLPTRTIPPVENLLSKPFTAHDLLQRVGRLIP